MSAYAFNKPCVATEVGGLPEMVVHEQMGLIVPPKDVQALADAICELLDDNTLQTKFSSNIEKEYSTGMLSWKYIVNQYERMYNSVL
jgi:glycosyltransferase involved in cell wall biosynthesis